MAGLQAAAGSPLGNFLDYKAGKRKKTTRKTTGRPNAAQRKRVGVSLLPFNKAAGTTATDRYSATITVWSAGGRTALNLSDADLGYAGTAGVTDSSDFFPAIIKPVLRLGTTPTDPTAKSGITGNNYQYWATNSYSVPFGRRTATPTDTEETRRAALSEACKAAVTPAYTIGYEPEVWRHDSRATVSDLAGTPAPPVAAP